MLSYNNASNARQSIDSLLPLGFEIVVCDNKSRDGTAEILRRYAQEGIIKLVEARCTRGRGRQLAFEQSTGNYVLFQLDCDDVFRPSGVTDLLSLYHEKYESMVLMTKKPDHSTTPMTICASSFVREIGGWRDLNWNEDWDFWERASEFGKYVYIPYPETNPLHEKVRILIEERKKTNAQKFSSRFRKYYDAYRIGRPPFATTERISQTQKIISWLAKTAVALRRSRLEPVKNPTFSDIILNPNN